jgi:predicted enzyme related to lactoylglutathione lyase
MNVRGTDFVVYQVSDMSRSVPFYRDTLGLSHTGGHGWAPGDKKPEEAWIEFDVPPTTLALYQSPDDTTLSPGGTMTVAVQNVEEALSELKAKGVKCLWDDPVDTPVCHFAIIFDPDGNQIGLHWRKDGTFG